MLTEQFFAPCPRGLEPVLTQELHTLGANQIVARDGGVAFSGAFSLMRRVNLHSRVASRVLLRLAHAPYRNENDVYRLARGVDWTLFFSIADTFKVKTDAIKSPLPSLDFVSLKVKDAICDVFRERTGGQRPSVDTAQPHRRIHVFLDAKYATLYLDTSGEALFKRGWRQSTREAPLRENLAAGILALTGWTPEQTLYDPMCGSGTFLVEAAHIALNRAPGRGRTFAFEQFPGFDAQAWQREKQQAQAAELPVKTLPIYGSDGDRYALAAAQENLTACGLNGAVALQLGDILEMSAPTAEGILVCNPPYGVRLDEQEHLAAFYPELGAWMKRALAGWRAYFLSADPQLAKGVRLSASKRTPLFNGALECRLFEYKMVAGSNRKPRSAE
ncbi:THUMP domain-containing class I SAM-dependent RNA methyltransferase [Aquaspirillum soli]|jgi:putative N6-adenine-specific DNA methylase|nr:class I SAM-dependent RNA methyltransferase [Aquaspirillum sp.]